MTAQQLESLLIDQALGELSDEASALLESYLAHFPERRAEAERVRGAVEWTEAAVLCRPLALEPDISSGDGGAVLSFPAKTAAVRPLLRFAAAVALLGLAVGAGFFAGRGGGPEAFGEIGAKVDRGAAPSPSSPWARYRVEPDGRLALLAAPDPNS